ncbi:MULTISPECIES: VOC family protein [Pseudonocardia]|jgi:predicted 3-demethylubiquinone-9 3-methyltransferase (glyoxalase superfamily)|uniref:Glyoxalase superfamily enzyme, possibly 3-demethylubiquinone-9 3-methyltransferase n=1 Tax=Pseudonocardia oroxyli TaxID=366584 RepID=A0A1G7RXJ7_PSEOR|nr:MULTISPECIES: VOC family protein [Pseudonocardia]MCF7551328.1 VOC family protein [Pseudonocardia sp. WMMC193]SDG15486.1 Glyoxalase superfamily enzyme, possibly 3-demethylubiquinone-9 3-methyltransferase [Pseudonocardia oroxyli]
MTTLEPFLMFQNGEAEEALRFYTGLFADGEVLTLLHTPEGAVQQAVFRVAGQRVRAFDSPVRHAWDFTPGVSLFVTCDGPEELEKLTGALLEGGAALMPLGDYGFGPFAFVTDRYGVSWQLSAGLPEGW